MHVSVGKKSLGKTVTNFSLAGSLDTIAMVSVDVKRNFSGDSKKICLQTTEVLLRAASGDLAKSKKLRDWKSRNAVLLLPFLTEAVVADRETAAEALLKTNSEKIQENGAKNTPEETDKDEDSGSKTDKGKEKSNTRSAKYATAHDATVGIAADCNNVLMFLQAVALKSQRLLVSVLSLRAYKRSTGWFCHWVDRHLKQQLTRHKKFP